MKAKVRRDQVFRAEQEQVGDFRFGPDVAAVFSTFYLTIRTLKKRRILAAD